MSAPEDTVLSRTAENPSPSEGNREADRSPLPAEPSRADSLPQEHGESDRFESFRTHVTAEHRQMSGSTTPAASPEKGSRFLVESRLTVSAVWMRSSFENAQRSLPIQDFPLKGFRPGKAPKHLVEKKRNERAIELSRGWVVDDLRVIVGEFLDVLAFGPVGVPTTLEWPEPSTPLTATFVYPGWIYPALDLDELCHYLRDVNPNTAELSERVYEFVSSRALPAGLEEALMGAEELRQMLPDEEALNRQHLRQALVNTLLANAFEITVTEEDLDKGYGEYAIENSLSLIEAKEELESVAGVFIQKVETDKAYVALRERLGRG